MSLIKNLVKLYHMEIESKAFSSHIIDSESHITFPQGIPGFEDQTQFQLFQLEGSEVVYSLQSLSDENTAFSVALPENFNINYQFFLTDQEESTLEIESIDDLLILLILHRDDSPDANDHPTIKGSIKAPIIINTKKRIGLQKTLEAVEQSITLTEKNNEIKVSGT